MTHSSAQHRRMDRRFAEALAKDGEHVHLSSDALVTSRARAADLRSMNGPSQAKVLLATLTECTAASGKIYLKGWAGASNLIGFRGQDDEEGRPTWMLFLTERLPARDAAPGATRRPPGAAAP